MSGRARSDLWPNGPQSVLCPLHPAVSRCQRGCQESSKKRKDMALGTAGGGGWAEERELACPQHGPACGPDSPPPGGTRSPGQ